MSTIEISQCEQLKTTFNDLKKGISQLEDLLRDYMATGDEKKKEEFEQKKRELAEKKSIFLTAYRKAVEEMLLMWERKTIQPLLTQDEIEVTDNGRIIIKGTLNLANTNITHFPQLIQQISGTLHLPKGVNEVPGLEKLFSIFFSNETTFNAPVLKKAESINGAAAKWYFPVLEEMTFLNAGSNVMEINMPKLVKAVALNLYQLEKGDFASLQDVERYIIGRLSTFAEFPALERVSDFVMPNASRVSVNKLLHVEGEFAVQKADVIEANFLKTVTKIFNAPALVQAVFPELESVGGIYSRIPEGKRFRDIFPKLRQVGISPSRPGHTVHFGGFYKVEEEISQLKARGELIFI